MKKLVLLFLILVSINIAYSITVEEGTLFNPSNSNTTYIINQTITASNIIVNDTCLIIVGGEVQGEYCYTYPTQTIMYIPDTVAPIVTYSFDAGNTYLNNITAQFNISDPILYRWNISIDDVNIESDINVNYTSRSINFTYDTANLAVGTHNLTIEVADGHTANKIKNYKVKKGLFNTQLLFETEKNKVKIKAKNDNFFDSYGYEKQRDRYTFYYKPSWKNKNKKEYTFTVNTEQPLTIINKPETKYKTWIISGNNWIDFYGQEIENDKTVITKIDNYTAEVTIKTNNPDIIQFESIGDLNIVTQSFIFEVINYTYSYTDPLQEQQSTTYTLNANLTNTSYVFSNINATLELAGTNYTVTKNQVGETIVFSYTYSVPSVNVNTTQENKWYISTSNQDENVSFNQTITPIEYNIELKREQTAELFNFTEVPGTNYSIYLDMYCSNSKTRFELFSPQEKINDSNCAAEYWYIILESSTDSYFRTLVPDLTQTNHTIYLLDLKDDSAVEIIFNLNDLVNQYDEGYLIAKKYINKTLTEVIKQEFDIETRVIFWLDQNEQYEIYAENEDGEEVLLDSLVADSAGTKNLVLPGLPLGVSHDLDNVYHIIGGNKSSGIATLYYRDITPSGFASINWTVYYYKNNTIVDNIYYTGGNNITPQVTGLNRSIAYISRLTIDHYDQVYDYDNYQILWWGDRTELPGFENVASDLKLWVATGTVLLIIMVSTVGSSAFLSLIGLIFGGIFAGIGWFEPLSDRFLGGLPIITVIFALFAVLMALSLWRRSKRE